MLLQFRLKSWVSVAQIALLAAYFLLFLCLEASAAPRLGLWVEVEGKVRALDTRQDLDAVKALLSQSKFTDIYCQVYREGRSWFPSKFADDTPFQSAKQRGLDPLAEILSFAHSRGIKVHAWMNMMRVENNPKLPLFRTLGTSVALKDNFGNSLLDYSKAGEPPGSLGRTQRLDTPGVWLDPSSRELRTYLSAIIEEILLVYPTLDGIHLDMIRFPFSTGGGLSFPYGKEATERFRTEKGKLPPKPGGTAGSKDIASQLEWETWKRAQLSNLVFDIRQVLNRAGGKQELSAAVIAWGDRAQRFAYQDWRAWLRGGALDFAIPMNYTKDMGSFISNAKHAAEHGAASKIQLGIGAWLMYGDARQLRAQIEYAKRNQFAGVVLFSYANLRSARGEALLREVFGSPPEIKPTPRSETALPSSDPRLPKTPEVIPSDRSPDAPKPDGQKH